MRLKKISKDFPGFARFLRFPTVFWLSSSDLMHRAVVWLGLLSSLGLIYGGPLSRLFVFGVYFSLFAIDFAIGLLYPWDVCPRCLLCCVCPCAEPLLLPRSRSSARP